MFLEAARDRGIVRIASAGARIDDDVHRGQFMLMLTKRFPNQTLDAVTPHGVSDSAGGKAVKQDLIKIVANETGLSEAQAGKAVNAFLMSIHDHLARNVEVQISGFGSFKVVERAAREGRNPRTGEVIQIGAGKAPKFSAGKEFKDAVNG